MCGCPKCGRMIDLNLQVCPYCHFEFEKLNDFFIKSKENQFIEDEKYAGLVKRTVAGLIDIYIITLITFIICYTLKISIKDYIISIPIFSFLYILINSILERTSWRGSLGKKIIGIKVFDKNENPETFGIAFFRNLAKILNVLTLGIGFLMCTVTKKRQALNDIIVNTYVIGNLKMADPDETDYAKIYKRLLSFIIDLGLIVILNYLISLIPHYTERYNVVTDYQYIIEDITILLSLIVTIFYMPFMQSRYGTIGEKITKIKVIKINGNKPGIFRLLIRMILIPIDIITLGFLLCLVTRKHQTLKDILTKTIVVDKYWK